MTSATVSFLLVCTGTFTGFLTIGIPLSIIPDYVHDQLGFDMFVTGIAIGLQSFTTVLTRKLAGYRADVRGSRGTARAGLLACAGAGVTYLLSTALASYSFAGAFAVFLAGRVLLGFAESLLLTGALTWGIGILGTRKSGKVMSWNGIAMHSAIALGAPIGIFVRSHFGFAVVAMIVAAVPLVGFLITHFVKPVVDLRHQTVDIPFARTLRAIWTEGTGLALGAIGFGALSSFISIYFRRHGWAFAGEGLVLFGACYIAVRMFFGNLPDRIGGLKVATVSLVVELIGQTTLWLAPTPTMAMIGIALTGAGFSLLFPSFGVHALKRVPPERKGTALGAFSAFFDISLGSTGPLCGSLIAAFGAPSIYLVGALATLGALGMVWLSSRRDFTVTARVV